MTRSGLMAAAVLLVAVAACGGESETTGVASLDELDPTDPGSSEEVEEVDTEEAVLAFTACLRDQGLDVEDPTFDGGGGFVFNFGEIRATGPDAEAGPDAEFRAALDECSPLMEGVGGRFDQADRTEIEDSLLAFSQCLRAEGLDVPDPDFSDAGGGPGGAGPFGGVLELDDPTAVAAFEKCQSELAFAGPGGGSGRIGGGNNGGDG
jgi:hypothetical protein